MVVAESNGLPIGLHVDSAQPHEMTLAEVTLQTVRVPRKRGRPRTRPKALIADKGETIQLSRQAAQTGNPTQHSDG